MIKNIPIIYTRKYIMYSRAEATGTATESTLSNKPISSKILCHTVSYKYLVNSIWVLSVSNSQATARYLRIAMLTFLLRKSGKIHC